LTFQERIQDPLLSQQFQAVTNAFAQYSKESPTTCAEIRYQVLGLLRMLCAGYQLPDKTRASSNANQYVMQVLTYIREHLDKKITLEDLASYVGISKYHLSHIFREYTGKTVFSAINQIRCNEAKQLIESGMSVSEAALCCGFENLSHFSNTFKQIFHVRPSSCCKETQRL
jgi:AraC-like DNA-binding protein